MIKKLQRKFILITMGSLLLVMLILIGLINGINIYQIQNEINHNIDIISMNHGKLPEFKKNDAIKGEKPIFGFEMNPETRFSTRFFVVEMNFDGSIRQIDTSHIAAVSSKDAFAYATEIMKGGKNTGYQGVYKYRIVEQPDGYMIIFLDCRRELLMQTRFLATSCVVALVTLVLLFILISLLSRRAIKPFIVNAEKQKLFITDAGHEIKTPLAIISANADVLELTGGTNEWITSIRNQTVRLDKLVKNLLTLSRMEEENIKLSFTEFDLSETVMKIAGPFTAIADTTNKRFQMKIQPQIIYRGDIGSMEQLISTLVDNAMKYSNDGGMIRITLTSGKKGPRLDVYNTVENLNVADLNKLFDRFYRADSSRARDTGGYGIGLSIAKSIVEAHHGKINAKSEDGHSICFTVQL